MSAKTRSLTNAFNRARRKIAHDKRADFDREFWARQFQDDNYGRGSQAMHRQMKVERLRKAAAEPRP